MPRRCYAILLSIVIVALAIVVLSIVGKDRYYIDRYSSGLLVCGALNFSLTLLMLLKRMYRLMQFEFDQHKFTNRAAYNLSSHWVIALVRGA